MLPLLFLWVAPAHALPKAAPTTLTVDIISSPWATVDSNGVPGVPDGRIPGVFVVEAVVTNTGTDAATDVVVSLDYKPSGDWILLAGEDPVRTLDELAPGATYYAYWFARYPNSKTDIGASHQYTVTADAANASPVATSNNFYGNPVSGKTVQTRNTISTGNSGVLQTSAEVVVGVAFTITQVYDLGTKPDDASFSPVGNDDFDPSAYQLLASEVRFFNDAGTGESTVTDRLYFPTVPDFADKAEVTYTFIASLESNTTLCPYAAFDFGSDAKYDENFCSDAIGTNIPIAGELTLSLSKQASSLTIQQNQLLTYTISYTNTGARPLRYTWVWDDIPTDVASIVASSISPPSDPNKTTDGRVVWNLGTIPEAGQTGSTGTLTFAVLVDGNGQYLADGTSLVNHAFFGISPGSLPQRSALTSTVTTAIQAPTITLSKTDGQDTAGPGDSLVYTLRVTNSGSVPATGLVVTDVLPSNVTPAGTITPSPDSQVGQTLVWDSLDPVPPGETLIITIPVVVAHEAPDGAILTNAATVTYENAAGHTFAAETATDTTLVQKPVLTINKTALDLNGSPAEVGDTIRYTLQVANIGSEAALDVTVTDDLPDGVTYVSASADQGTATGSDPVVWSIPELPHSSVVTLLITVTINNDQAGRVIVNTASVVGDNVPDPPDDPPAVCPDGSPEPCDPIEGEPALAINKLATDLNGPPIVVGDTILYTLLVTNTSAVTALDVTVTDDLPDGVTYVDASSSRGTVSGTDLVTWSIGDLEGDTSASLLITVTIDPDQAEQVITNTGSVTSGNVTDPPDDPTPVCPDGTPEPCDPGHTPVPITTLAFDKTAEDVNGPPLVVRDTIRYSLQVTNTGTYTAFNVVVTDTLPAEVTLVNTDASQGFTSGSDPVVWYVGDLPPNGGAATLLITVTLDDEAAGQSIVNVGTVSGGNTDPPPDPEVCPDGSEPVNGVCENKPEESGGGVFLPIIRMNAK